MCRNGDADSGTGRPVFGGTRGDLDCPLVDWGPVFERDERKVGRAGGFGREGDRVGHRETVRGFPAGACVLVPADHPLGAGIGIGAGDVERVNRCVSVLFELEDFRLSLGAGSLQRAVDARNGMAERIDEFPFVTVFREGPARVGFFSRVNDEPDAAAQNAEGAEIVVIVVFAVISALEDRRELRIVPFRRAADDHARIGEKADRFGKEVGGFSVRGRG